MYMYKNFNYKVPERMAPVIGNILKMTSMQGLDQRMHPSLTMTLQTAMVPTSPPF